MPYYYDLYGWLSQEPIPGRQTDIEPPDASTVPEGYGINFTGYSWIITPLQAPPVPTIGSAKYSIGIAVLNYMDQKAATREYDNIQSVCTYKDSTVAKYRLEAITAIEFRDNCWLKCEQILAEVEAGTRPIPTPEEVLAELPDLVWPT